MWGAVFWGGIFKMVFDLGILEWNFLEFALGNFLELDVR